MERKINIELIKNLFKENFIGQQELKSISNKLVLNIPKEIPNIPFSIEELERKKDEYILFLSVTTLKDGSKLDILKMREIFGVDPDESEPCFYNQDWYLKEDFISQQLDLKWNLLRKNVFEETRAVDPKEIEKKHNFPNATICAYAFFIYQLVHNIILWQYDFIWCSDTDHNGDRIYVGKYTDIDGVNKNGFSIHRHLALRNCYASIDSF